MLAAKTFFETPVTRLTPKMEQEFFSSLMTSNKTYKTTFRQRFADIDERLLRQLSRNAAKTIDVLDVGVSSGVSTIELYDTLRTAYIDVTVVATDLFVDAFLVRVWPKCYALIDAAGYPLRFDLPLVTMKPWVTARDFRTGVFVLRKIVNKTFTSSARRILRDPDDSRITRVKLVTPRLLANDHVSIRADDVSHYNPAFVGRFDLIRTANILNKGYFSAPALRGIVTNLRRYLKGASSSLLVVRTHEDHTNHGTLFRLGDDGRFTVVQRFGAGSEVEDLVVQSPV